MATPRKTLRHRWNPRNLLAFAITLVTVGIVVAGAGFGRTTVSASASGPVHYQQVTVASGDTLWDIAGRAGSSADRRDLVERIRDLNGLGARAIQPGQVLRVPMD